MRIEHCKALELESIVRKVYHCDRGGMGGFIDADHFETSPFDAALIALAPLWKNLDFQVVEDFLIKWEDVLRHKIEDTESVSNYIYELDQLVDSVLK